MLERAGNYGVPLALLVWSLAAAPQAGWLERIEYRPLDAPARTRVGWVLRLTTATLLLGHGLLAAGGKPALAGHLAAAGLGPDPVSTTPVVVAQGWLEIGLAALVLLSGAWPVLLVAFTWKVATELLFPITGDSMWEFVERGGSYGAPLALAILAALPVARGLAATSVETAMAAAAGPDRPAPAP
jgi:hypothetical protein